MNPRDLTREQLADAVEEMFNSPDFDKIKFEAARRLRGPTEAGFCWYCSTSIASNEQTADYNGDKMHATCHLLHQKDVRISSLEESTRLLRAECTAWHHWHKNQHDGEAINAVIRARAVNEAKETA